MVSNILQRPTTEITSVIKHRDYTENDRHSPSVAMEANGYLSNGWAISNGSNILASTSADSSRMSIRNCFLPNGNQQMNSMANPAGVNSVDVILDHNKNHQCELPLSSSARVSNDSSSASPSTLGSHHMATNGHAARLKPSCNHISAAIAANCHSKQSAKQLNESYEDPPFHIAIMCYLSYVVLIVFGYLRDFMRRTGLEKNLAAVERNREVVFCSFEDGVMLIFTRIYLLSGLSYVVQKL